MATFILFLFLGTLYASLFEWLLHRFVMHRPVGSFDYAYRAHAVTHHGRFRADHSYHLAQHPDDAGTIPMAWWNGPALVAISSAPYWLAAWACGAWMPALYVTAAIAAYYGAYEYLHWCMHKPAGRWFEGTQVFARLNGHHLLHHHRPDRNFNVVLPFWDLVLGTLITRAGRKFPQAGAPAPDVQPP